MIDYANELNESQLRAVEYNDGPSLVIAGAGSGKTRVLTYKIARLMEDGYKPWEILALTFTNKAAAEMKERIARRVGEEQARYLWMGTFHSLFAKILRRESERIGYTSNYTIYDQSDSRSLVNAIVKELELDDLRDGHNNKVYNINKIQYRISEAKNALITAEMYRNDSGMVDEDTNRRMPMIWNIYKNYEERLRKANAMDFDDLLMLTYYLFKQHPDVLENYRDRFRFVLVDEYQDTNLAQNEVVWQLTAEHQHVCVVGDDSQSIYSFRGARIDNILTFQNRYENPRLFKLEENYRSTQSIVKAANNLIANNRNRIPKVVFTDNESGDPIKVHEVASEWDEARYVARQIEAIRRRCGLEWSDFAILYRTNSQAGVFENELKNLGIDCKVFGDISFYQHKEVKNVIDYFRLVVNPHDEEAFKHIVNYPSRGIGDTTIQRLVTKALETNVSLWEVACNPDYYELQVSKATKNKLMKFCELIEGFRELSRKADAYETGMQIVKLSGIEADLTIDNSDAECSSEEKQEKLFRQKHVQILLEGMKEFVDPALEEGRDAIGLSDYLAQQALLTNQDIPNESDKPLVSLMTVHSAKGLEFDTVFVTGLEDSLFPNRKSESPNEIEEERRLFYVAITRSKKRCILTYAKKRNRFGQCFSDERSRFIDELDLAPRQISSRVEELNAHSSIYSSSFPRGKYGSFSTGSITNKQIFRNTNSNNHSTNNTPTYPSAAPSSGVGRGEAAARPRRLISLGESGSGSPSVGGGAASVASLTAGMVIEHERFGRGTVMRVEGNDVNAKAVIRFDNVGEKTLLLKFARFKVLS